MLKDKITKENFLKYLEEIKKSNDLVDRIYDSSYGIIDIVGLREELAKPYQLLEKVFFTTAELEIISWYLYEDVEKKIFDYETEEVVAELNSDEALWDYLNNEELFDPNYTSFKDDNEEAVSYLKDIFHAEGNE